MKKLYNTPEFKIYIFQTDSSLLVGTPTGPDTQPEPEDKTDTKMKTNDATMFGNGNGAFGTGWL